MNKIVNKCLFAGDKCVPVLHLRQPGFIYSACGTFTKHRERIQIFRAAGALKHLYRNELDKGCFDHHTAYSDSKDLAKRTVSDKIMKDTGYEIAINPKYNGHQRGLASILHKFFVKKKGQGAIATSKVGASVNEELDEELHKPVIIKFNRWKVYAMFKDKI